MDEQDDEDQHQDLASTAPAWESRNLLTTPSVNAPINVPNRLPTPPEHHDHEESMM